MRGKRVRVEEGIYRDTSGLAAIITVRGRRREKRFHPGCDLHEIRVWLADTRAELVRLAPPTLTSDRRTLARNIATYLRTRKGRPSYGADRSHFKPWIVAFGRRERHDVTRAEIEREIARWTCAARTMRHRVRVLRELYEYFDGGTAHPLTKKLHLPRPPRSTPMPIAHDLIERVARSLLAGKSGRHGYGWEPVKSRARFLVYAMCGQRPAQIGRAVAGDIDLARKIWWVRPAKGGDPVALPLNEQMIQAWQIFIASEAWGTFDTTSFAKVLRRHGWPKGLRPYRLRHTFAIDLLLAGVKLETLQGLLGHLDIRTTRIYAPVQLALEQEAIGKRTLSLDLSGATQEVPRTTATERKRLNKSGTDWTTPRTKKKAAS